MTSPPIPGIRVLRPLARDPHLESLLVQLELPEPRPAVLARARDGRGAESRRVELVALDRARGPGVVELLDVRDDDCAPALLLQHVSGPLLSVLLAEREQWRAGEAVAVLEPLAIALARMHAAGVAHGALDASRVVSTAAGPVIVDLSRAELFDAGAPEVVLARLDTVVRDRLALRGIGVELLRRVSGSRSQAARLLADQVELAPAERVIDTLVAGSRELAAPIPVDAEPEAVARDETPSTDAAPHGGARLIPVSAPPASAEHPSPARSGARMLGVPLGALRARLTAWGAPLRARIDALPTWRRRVVLAGCAATATAAVLLATAPSGGAAPGGRATPTPTASASGAAVPDAAAAVLQGDDPVAAATALLARREECFTELSTLCLEEVDQPGSAALAVDRAGIRALRAGAEAEVPRPQPGELRVVERLGDGALLAIGPETAPASLLVMRSEAGWRIRDWIAAETVSGMP
ncbi:MAG: hypothetical protein DI534_00380 [Leifsonia xyli]|nr:MAG: hypothetical protein DI534_00380 [Leifsonia xyli]